MKRPPSACSAFIFFCGCASEDDFLMLWMLQAGPSPVQSRPVLNMSGGSPEPSAVITAKAGLLGLLLDCASYRCQGWSHASS